MAQRRYDHERWARQQAREEQRQERADLAAQKAVERERKQEAIEAGRAQAEQHNRSNADKLLRLTTILHRGLDRRAAIDLTRLRRHDRPPPLNLGERGEPKREPEWQDYAPAEPGALSGLFGGRARHERRVTEARAEFERARRQHNVDEAARQRWVQDETERHQAVVRRHRAEVEQHNQRIEALRAGLSRRDRESVEAYLERAVARTPLQPDIPHQIEVAYTPRGEQAVVRFELPPPDVIPAVASYTYVATTGEMREKKRAAAEVSKLYRSVVSQIALLYMRDLFESDPDLENVELGGHVHAISPATGQREYPCLISFAVDRARYSSLNLRDVTPEACLTHLNALVSRHPHAVEPVTPVRDFDLARYSFVESVDVVSGLDSRPDLTRMTPTEFEHFVRQLFEARGLEGWTTERTFARIAGGQRKGSEI